MNITDEKLSAFLDAELSPDDMESIRQALAVNDDLVMRLAELSQVDQWVVENAQVIDAKPIPQGLVKLAQQIDNRQQTSNVVQLSTWKKAVTNIGTPMSLAAGVVLAITVGIVSMNYQQQQAFSSQIAQVLDSAISGQTHMTEDGISVKTQLSFANQAGDFCRQYLVLEAQNNSSNIACKENNNWRLHTSVQSSELNTQDYQTASNEQNLDKVIDGMIVGSPLNREQEQNAILKQWQSN